MKLKTKKIIAREFLVFLLCIAIAIIAFLSIYPYNYLKQNHINNLTKEIAAKRTLADSLSKSYAKKYDNQIWFTNKIRSKFNVSKSAEYGNLKLWNTLYDIAKSDSIKFKWGKVWSKELVIFIKELGFETPDKFQSFILKNITNSKDIKENRVAYKINAEAEALQIKSHEISQKILSLENQLRTAGLFFTIAVAIFFFLRYIFYGVRWSVSTLNRKNE